MSFGVRVALAAAAVLAVGCNADLFHSTDWPTRCGEDPSACGVGTAGAGGVGTGGGASATTSTGVSSVTTSGSGSGGGVTVGTGGSTGTGAICGNGVVEPGEQCDPGAAQTSSCVNCMVACSQADEHLDSTTLHCYRYVSATPIAWADARAACGAWGGDLAAISSAAENGFVTGIITMPSYLGGTDAAMDGTFVWTNGEPFSYANWNAGEPNNYGGAPEDCIEMYATGFWNDSVCTALLPYVCERVAPGVP